MDDFQPQRDDKSTSFTITVTVLLMAVLTIAAWALKRSAPAAAKPSGRGAQGALETARQPALGNGKASIPLGDDGNPKSEYQIVTNCQLEDDPASDGDTFRVMTPQGSHLFRLYWVQAVQMNGGTPDSIREAMDHFGLKTEDELRELASEGRDFTQNLLRSVHFWLVTRWEKDPSDGAFLCFAYASDGAAPQPALQNVALMLVQNGLAIIRPCSRPLPEEDTSAGDFQNQLTAAEEEAVRTRSGGWAGKES